MKTYGLYPSLSAYQTSTGNNANNHILYNEYEGKGRLKYGTVQPTQQ